MAKLWCADADAFTTVAERLKPESLYQRFIDHRESLGFEGAAAVRRRTATVECSVSG